MSAPTPSEQQLATSDPQGHRQAIADSEADAFGRQTTPSEAVLAMFDALGEPRTRYVRVSLDGSHCVMHPSEGDTYLDDAKQCGDDSNYIVVDVYLSEREFEDLPEFDGF